MPFLLTENTSSNDNSFHYFTGAATIPVTTAAAAAAATATAATTTTTIIIQLIEASLIYPEQIHYLYSCIRKVYSKVKTKGRP